MALENYLQTLSQGRRETESPATSTATSGRPRIVGSDELLKGDTELWITHGEERYRLRRTRSGKLYLVK